MKRKPPAAAPELTAAGYRLGLKAEGADFVETLVFLSSDGLELGYYTVHADPGGCFMDFNGYDQEQEARAVFECFVPCGGAGTVLVRALEDDLRAMGLYLPELRQTLTDGALIWGRSFSLPG
ncbi:hypothetical protein SDC9_70875 [bioreactor metagenome]|uniref:Uncharacterized protein n=1 Tax=bioreactor metagenome TaxID=1076179 RepID=A0A644YCZ0_9ZZZZ